MHDKNKRVAKNEKKIGYTKRINKKEKRGCISLKYGVVNASTQESYEMTHTDGAEKAKKRESLFFYFSSSSIVDKRPPYIHIWGAPACRGAKAE